MSRFQLSRRTMLRGLGASMALPLLDAMIPQTIGGGVARAAASAANAVGGPVSAADVKADFSVLSGLALDGARAHGDGAGDHARSAAAFLTGAHPYKTAGRNIK